MSKLCKRILLILTVFSSFLTLFACSAIQIDTYHVELPQDKYQLRVGQEIEALPIVSKNGQECDLEVSYHSYDASIATYVDGKIVALKAGEVRIKVTLKSNSKVYATALVTVVNDDSLIVDFNYEKTMIKGTTQLLTYELLVEKNRKLTFTSSNENVATIDELGNIKAIAVGTTTIETVVSSLYDEGVSKTYKLVIEVKDLTFAINYVLDGGTNSENNPDEYVPEKLPLLLENPTKSGYKFVGWYDNENFAGEAITEISAGTMGDITLYAKWNALDYRISYELNGGTNAENPDGYDVSDLPVSLHAPSRTGYIFKGWYMGENRVLAIPVGTTGNVVVSAKWEIYPIRVNDKYYLTLKDAYDNANDNDVIYVGVGTFDLDFEIAKSVEIIGKSSKETTIKVAADYITKVNAENIIISDVTLKGVGANVGGIYFQPGTKAHYFTIKNSEITDMNTVYKSISAMSNNVVVTLENNTITKVGQFLIWATTGIDTVYLVDNTIVASNCGTIANSAATLLRMRDGKTYVYNNVFTGTTPSIDGLFEAGTDNVEFVEVKYNTFKNVTKFVHINGGKPVNFDENLYLDADGNVLTAVPSQVAGDGVIADTTIASSEEERAEFYYVFLHTQTLNLVLNGGNCENLPTTYVEGRVTTLPIPSKVGYTFLGWYNGETKVDSITADASGELTLEAKWSINSYKLIFDVDGTTTEKTFEYGENVVAIEDPTKEDYIFVGWTPTLPTAMPAENITVKATWKLATVHAGTEDDPYSVEDALLVAGTLSTGNSTSDNYYVKGTVSKITEISTSYGNATFEITVNGKTILVFRAKNEGNQNFTSTDDLYVGDEVVIYGNITNYKGTLEITNCYVVSNDKVTRPEPIEEPELVDKTLQEIIDMDDATNKEASYKITVIVLGWGKSLTSYDATANKYGNMIVSDLEGLNKIVVFGATATISALIWDSTNGKYTYTNKQDFLTNAITKSINIGDTLELIVIRDSFDGSAQLNAIVTKVTPKQAVTSNIIFDLDGGTCADLPTSYEEGTELSLPTPTKEGYDFLGWEYNGTIITSITATMTGDLTLTAKWKESGTTLYFEKVTSVNDITDDGLYLIVYENGEKAYAFDSSLATLDATNNYKELALSDLGIAVDDTSNSVTFRITKNSDGTFAILSASGNYIYRSTTSNGLEQSTTKSNSTNTITIDANGNVLIVSSNTTLKFNSTSGQTRFRYYKSGQSSISLYKYSTTSSDPSKTHKINYVNLPEGTTNSNPTSYKEGETITLVDPVLAGYTFDGWFDNAECTGTKITEISASSTTDITLYAKFTKKATHKITYQFNVNSESITNSNPIEFIEGVGVTLKDASLTSYDFIGWYSDSEYTNKITAIDQSWTTDIVIYGKFETSTEKSIVSTFKDKNLSTNETIDLMWKLSIAANSFEARGVQIGAAKGTVQLSTTNSTYKVKKIVMIVSTNGTANKNSIALSVGEQSVSAISLKKANDYEIEFVLETATLGDIIFTINDANKSVYIKSITIYYI